MTTIVDGHTLCQVIGVCLRYITRKLVGEKERVKLHHYSWGTLEMEKTASVDVLNSYYHLWVRSER